MHSENVACMDWGKVLSYEGWGGGGGGGKCNFPKCIDFQCLGWGGGARDLIVVEGANATLPSLSPLP